MGRMKKNSCDRWLLALVLVLVMACGSCVMMQKAFASAATQENPISDSRKNGLIKEENNYHYYKNGVLQKSVWKTLGGKKYYFKENGNAATYSCKVKNKYYVFNTRGQLLAPKKNAIVKVGKNYYYVTKKGRAISGWHIIKKKLYYTSKSGKCAVSGKKDDVSFTKYGYAKNNTAAKCKMKAMKVVSSITNSKMSKAQKLRACFNYTMSTRFVGAKYPKNYKKLKKGWYYTTALDTMTTRSCNCYGYASTMAILARELGYTPYIIEAYIGNGGEHCFVKINGRYYDNMGNRFGTAPQAHRVKNSWKL